MGSNYENEKTLKLNSFIIEDISTTSVLSQTYQGQLRTILSNPVLFSVDLYQAGLGEKIEGLFLELSAGAKVARNALRKYLS